MKYAITHTTTYKYSASVSLCQNAVIMKPRNTADVKCVSFELTIAPTPVAVYQRNDRFGNTVHEFSIDQIHRQLSIRAESLVAVSNRQDSVRTNDVVLNSWEAVRQGVGAQNDPRWLEACVFLFDSPFVRRSTELADYALAAFLRGRPVAEATADLVAQIHRDFTYDATSTKVDTPTSETFRLRRGVCQDLAHVAIGCLRSLGIPARYISGYIRTIPPVGQPRMVGADQSHAWLSAYCGEQGWIDFDPTNNVRCLMDHVTVACGRDYHDVAPVRGIFLGGGKHKLRVSVDMVEQ